MFINGPKIKALREHQKLTQKELAEKAQIDPRSISKYERGKLPTCTDEVGRKLADALNVGIGTIKDPPDQTR